MERERFRELVQKAWEELGPEIHALLDNVAILVEEWPDQGTLEEAGVSSRLALLGFYRGTPRTQRGYNYSMAPPDTITLYQRPIERAARRGEPLLELIKQVLRHEIAHHLGIDDEGLRELGAY